MAVNPYVNYAARPRALSIITLNPGDTITVYAQPLADNVPISISGTPIWESSDEDALALTPAEDGLSCSIVAGDIVGGYNVTISLLEVDASQTAYGNVVVYVVVPASTEFDSFAVSPGPIEAL